MITFVLGGSRSGKSKLAERLAVEAARGPADPASGGEQAAVLYLATGWADADDADMTERIRDHQQRRSAAFRTLEVGADLPAALRAHPDQTVLVDALGTWVARHLDFVAPIDDLVDALDSRRAPSVVVSDEVGLGVHPETPVGRQFRDALGLANQRVAARADTALLVVAGRVLRLDEAP